MAVGDGKANIANGANFNKASFGEYGYRILTAETSVVGEFFRVLVPMNGSATLTAVNDRGDALSGDIDQPIYGLCTTVIVSSGTVFAYLADTQP